MPVSMKEYVESHPSLKTIIYAGKGGLGKTTCSAASSYWFAQNGRRALCFSTDPQASLSDIFERDIFGKGETRLKENLYVVEIDADRRIQEFHDEIRNKIKEMYKLDEIPEEIDKYISSTAYEPAMHESATYDAMAELLSSGKYDIYIFDMPPFGHGVRMISMATILDAWIEKMTEARKKAAEYLEAEVRIRGSSSKVEDEVLNELASIRERLDFFKNTLTNPESTAFFMVLIPEKMAILDTERAIKMFEKLDIKLSGVIVNQVYPFELLEIPNLSEFLKHRINMQKGYLREIRDKFGDLVRAIIPMFDREPKGLEMIAKVADRLFENPNLELMEMV